LAVIGCGFQGKVIGIVWSKRVRCGQCQGPEWKHDTDCLPPCEAITQCERDLRVGSLELGILRGVDEIKAGRFVRRYAKGLLESLAGILRQPDIRIS
jgi:hypothetical protein